MGNQALGSGITKATTWTRPRGDGGALRMHHLRATRGPPGAGQGQGRGRGRGRGRAGLRPRRSPYGSCRRSSWRSSIPPAATRPRPGGAQTQGAARPGRGARQAVHHQAAAAQAPHILRVVEVLPETSSHFAVVTSESSLAGERRDYGEVVGGKACRRGSSRGRPARVRPVPLGRSSGRSSSSGARVSPRRGWHRAHRREPGARSPHAGRRLEARGHGVCQGLRRGGRDLPLHFAEPDDVDVSRRRPRVLLAPASSTRPRSCAGGRSRAASTATPPTSFGGAFCTS